MNLQNDDNLYWHNYVLKLTQHSAADYYMYHNDPRVI